MIDRATLSRFREIITVHTGLVVPEHDIPYLRDKLIQRLESSRSFPRDLSGAEAYLLMLEEESSTSKVEWQALVLELTTGESYFFRDAGQIRLLREMILPELIQHRDKEQQLRVWSAGCSTGEEPYSLAILIQQLLPLSSSWRIMLKGTDINEFALQRAREARYGRWAFRGVSEGIVERYFVRNQHEWLLDPSVRSMVQFNRLNLIKDTFPDSTQELCDMDLIVCRNVFIYFGGDAIAGIMARFAACLRPGGYIMTGHAEVQHPISQMIDSGVLPLVVRYFPDSMVFQRPLSIATPVRPQPKAAPIFTPKPPPNKVQRRTVAAPSVVRVNKPEVSLKEARVLFEQGAYTKAIQRAESVLDAPLLVFDACLLLARIYANLGDIAPAESRCREALRYRPFAVEPHFLLASIVHERGDVEQTKDLLKKVLYLDRAHVPAYLQLAAIHQEEGDEKRARQMRLAALDVLHGLPVSERVEHYEEWTVKALVMELEKLLGESSVEATS